MFCCTILSLTSKPLLDERGGLLDLDNYTGHINEINRTQIQAQSRQEESAFVAFTIKFLNAGKCHLKKW